MKKLLCLAAGLLALNLTPGFSQPAALPQPAPVRAPRYAPPALIDPLTGLPTGTDLTKFNLDFPGGTPKQLVAAIEKAMGKPLNVIVPTDEKSAKAMFPPIKVNEMDVVKLFNTLRENTKKYGGRDGSDLVSQAGFFTMDGSPSDNSLWTFSTYEKQSLLTLFSIDFSGGSPELLVKAIEKATGKPLNVIIPTDGADVALPPLKMNNVDVQRLFSALEVASIKQVKYLTSNFGRGNQSYSIYNTSYGFKTDGAVNDNSVWYFHANNLVKEPLPPVEKTSQFYSLADYLDAGLTVEDITTVIQNGWKMAGVSPTPELKYHKETKLLMAYGEPDKMATISDVLKVLKPKEDLVSQMTRQIQKEKLEKAGATNSLTEKSGK